MTYPESWEIPRWHADFGDPAVEVELLRAFCVSARETFPRLKTTLCAIEEGYQRRCFHRGHKDCRAVRCF